MTDLVTITNDDDDILRTRSEEIKEEEFGAGLFQVAQTLKLTVYQSDGHLVGLAANQIGILKRIMAVVRDGTGIIQVMINPSISSTSAECATVDEGCGSIPGIVVAVKRPITIQALWTDITGKEHDVSMGGYEGRIFQHELDHLDGKLITDYGLPRVWPIAS